MQGTQSDFVHKLRAFAPVWMPPFLLLSVYLCRGLLLPVVHFIAEYIFFCVFYETTGHYCMGCGCTRSVVGILHGDFATAWHNNPVPFFGILWFLLVYIEKCAAAFGKRLRLYPRNIWFWMTLVGLQFIWNIIRNIVPSMHPITISY